MYGVHEKSIKQLNRDLLFIEVQDIRREKAWPTEFIVHKFALFCAAADLWLYT